MVWIETMFRHPQPMTLRLYNDMVKGITVAEVNAALPRIFEGAGPLVQVSTPIQIEGDKATVEAEYNKAHAVPVSAPQAEAAVTWPYTDFGKPGTVAEQKDIADLGVVTVRFDNGVKLTIKQTNFRQDEILVAVQVGNGYLDLPKESSVWLTNAFIAGGLKKLTLDDIDADIGVKSRRRKFFCLRRWVYLFTDTPTSEISTLSCSLWLLTSPIPAIGPRQWSVAAFHISMRFRNGRQQPAAFIPVMRAGYCTAAIRVLLRQAASKSKRPKSKS